jgi:hypothetical protein
MVHRIQHGGEHGGRREPQLKDLAVWNPRCGWCRCDCTRLHAREALAARPQEWHAKRDVTAVELLVAITKRSRRTRCNAWDTAIGTQMLRGWRRRVRHALKRSTQLKARKTSEPLNSRQTESIGIGQAIHALSGRAVRTASARYKSRCTRRTRCRTRCRCGCGGSATICGVWRGAHVCGRRSSLADRLIGPAEYELARSTPNVTVGTHALVRVSSARKNSGKFGTLTICGGRCILLPIKEKRPCRNQWVRSDVYLIDAHVPTIPTKWAGGIVEATGSSAVGRTACLWARVHEAPMHSAQLQHKYWMCVATCCLARAEEGRSRGGTIRTEGVCAVWIAPIRTKCPSGRVQSQSSRRARRSAADACTLLHCWRQRGRQCWPARGG